MKKVDYEIYKKIYEQGLSKCHSVQSDLPTQIALEITRNCNLSCEYCPRESNPLLKDKLNITTPIIKDLIDVWKIAKSVVICGGGEPFLHIGIFEILKLIREQNNETSIAITTNGTIKFNKESVSKLNDMKVNLVFSLDSVEPYTLRRGSQTVNVVDNIKKVVRIKKENNYEFPLLVIVSMVTTDGIDMLPDVLQFAIEQGAVSYHVEKINPIWNDLCEKQRADIYQPEKVKQLFEKLYEIAEGKYISIEGKLSYKYGHTSEMIEKLDRGPCLDPWLFAVISATGMLAPCPNYPYPFRHGLIRGDRSDDDIRNQLFGGSRKYDKLLKVGPVMELWNGDELKLLRKHHIDNTPYYNCQNCRRLSEHNSWLKCT